MALWMLGLLLPLIVAASRPQWLRSNAPPPPPDYEQQPEWMNDMPMPPSVPPYCVELENRDPCTPLAYVRAQDLRPTSVARGELRILVPKGCKETLNQVELRLALEEYEHVQLPDSRWKMPWDYLRSQGPPATYETTTHTAWTTQCMLASNLKGTNEVIRPFSVAIPNTNYPAATARQVYSTHDNDSHSSLQAWALYRYVAVVSLSNGKTYEITAGFTSFQHIVSSDGDTTSETIPVTAVPTKDPAGDFPMEAPSWLPIPGPKRRPGISPDASADLEVHFPKGRALIDGDELPIRVRIVKHVHIADNISPFEQSIFMGIHLSSSFIPARDGYERSHMSPHLRASVSPTTSYSTAPQPGTGVAILSIPLSGEWVDIPRLRAPENSAASFDQTFGRVEGTLMVGLQPAMWCDADDGWSVRACNVDPSGRGLEAYVPVRMLTKPSGAKASAPPPVHYLAPEATAAPVLLPGWREAYDGEFPTAEPHTEKKTQTETQQYTGVREPWDEWDERKRQRECAYSSGGPSDGDDFPGPELELVERTFAGVLWARKYGLGG